jgi:hypothetical protein
MRITIYLIRKLKRLSSGAIIECIHHLLALTQDLSTKIKQDPMFTERSFPLYTYIKAGSYSLIALFINCFTSHSYDNL